MCVLVKSLKPEFNSILNRSRSIPIQWTHNKICFEDLSFTYNLTALAPTPECSKTVITNETEVVIDGLCSGTEYQVFLFGKSEEILSEVEMNEVNTLSMYIYCIWLD